MKKQRPGRHSTGSSSGSGEPGRPARGGRARPAARPPSRGARPADGRGPPKEAGRSGGRSFARAGGRSDERKAGPGRSDERNAKAGRSKGRKPDAGRAPSRRFTEAPQRETERQTARPKQRFIAQPTPEPEAAAPVATSVQKLTVSVDEGGMRVDRYLEAKFPGLSFSHIHRVVRKGELRVDGKRVDGKDRLVAGQQVRIPPLRIDPPKRAPTQDPAALDELKAMILYEDDDVLVLNKPYGLAVQGGSGMVKHVDGMLEAMRDRAGQRPRLVHRLDRETAGCLLVAKTRYAASAIARTFRTRSARKIYWALVTGVPKPRQGRVSTYLAKEEREDESLMRIARHGEEGASHAVTYYAIVETAAQQLAWLSLKPVTGRTHQLRAHMEHIGHPIVGDSKYFRKENWSLPGGMQNRLHLLARRLVVPHPRGGMIDVTAPLPPHMQQTWNLLGFDVTRYDPIVESPEE
jgi:23S rRNA pseudouridine955/2504/2580 synthase